MHMMVKQASPLKTNSPRGIPLLLFIVSQKLPVTVSFSFYISNKMTAQGFFRMIDKSGS